MHSFGKHTPSSNFNAKTMPKIQLRAAKTFYLEELFKKSFYCQYSLGM